MTLLIYIPMFEGANVIDHKVVYTFFTDPFKIRSDGFGLDGNRKKSGRSKCKTFSGLSMDLA